MNKLYYGDCLDVMTEIPDRSIDMVLCDLPYGQTANKWDCLIPFVPLWQQYMRVAKENAAFCRFKVPLKNHIKINCDPLASKIIML